MDDTLKELLAEYCRLPAIQKLKESISRTKGQDLHSWNYSWKVIQGVDSRIKYSVSGDFVCPNTFNIWYFHAEIGHKGELAIRV